MWEHSFIRDLTEKEVEDLLEKTEFNGWELVNSHRYTGIYSSTPKYSLFFKRPKEVNIDKIIGPIIKKELSTAFERSINE